MKKTIYVLSLSLFAFIACNKDEEMQQEQTLNGSADLKTSISNLCHYDAVTGLYSVISVGGNGANGHLKHGDVLLIDADGDGYVTEANDCLPFDCDDTDALVNPGATEICGNGIDDNCDGNIDENCFANIEGTYSLGDHHYFRIGVENFSTWPATTVNIVKVSQPNLYVINAFGPFQYEDSYLYFTISDTGEIDYPATTPDGTPQVRLIGLTNEHFITCDLYPEYFTNVSCSDPFTNTASYNSVGEVVLNMVFGYNTVGSGTREFSQVLTRIQ